MCLHQGSWISEQAGAHHWDLHDLDRQRRPRGLDGEQPGCRRVPDHLARNSPLTFDLGAFDRHGNRFAFEQVAVEIGDQNSVGSPIDCTVLLAAGEQHRQRRRDDPDRSSASMRIDSEGGCRPGRLLNVEYPLHSVLLGSNPALARPCDRRGPERVGQIIRLPLGQRAGGGGVDRLADQGLDQGLICLLLRHTNRRYWWVERFQMAGPQPAGLFFGG